MFLLETFLRLCINISLYIFLEVIHNMILQTFKDYFYWQMIASMDQNFASQPLF